MERMGMCTINQNQRPDERRGRCVATPTCWDSQRQLVTPKHWRTNISNASSSCNKLTSLADGYSHLWYIQKSPSLCMMGMVECERQHFAITHALFIDFLFSIWGISNSNTNSDLKALALPRKWGDCVSAKMQSTIKMLSFHGWTRWAKSGWWYKQV